MLRRTMLPLAALLLLGCGDGPTDHFSVRSGVTACETEEWARERDALLEDDPAEAERFAADRCFIVETSVDLIVTSQPFAAGIRGKDRWVEVGAVGGGTLEHLASAALRTTLGLEARSSGWLRRSQLTEQP